MKLFIISISALLILAFSENEQANTNKLPVQGKLKSKISQPEFSVQQIEPSPTFITGPKAKQIKKYLDVLFSPCVIMERKKTEKALVELISPYKLSPGSVGELAGCRWSCPINNMSTPDRRLMVAFFHCSATAPGLSLWAVHETKDGAIIFPFEGHTKGCGIWQILEDLNNDGTPEIIVKHFVGQYEGAGTNAIWSAIYEWQNNKYIRADEKFPQYYTKNVIPKYKKILAESISSKDHEDPYIRRLYRKCEFVLDKALSISQKDNSEPYSTDK